MDSMEIPHRCEQGRRDSSRSSKVPKLEGLELHGLLMDDPPEMEISNNSMGLNAVRSLMDIHNTALSLVGAAHLATLRAYGIKFLSLLSVKLEPETGLRPPRFWRHKVPISIGQWCQITN